MEALFPHLSLPKAGRELSKALSTARAALSSLGGAGACLLQANRTHIWADPRCGIEVDLQLQLDSLRAGLMAAPGNERDQQLVAALQNQGTLLEGEPLAEWAVRPREQLEWTRQEARLTLARDRGRGLGRTTLEAVVEAWEASLAYDETCEEAASALIRLYAGQGRPAMVGSTYERYRNALEELGLRTSPALDEVYLASAPVLLRPEGGEGGVPVAFDRQREERRLVTVLFAEFCGPAGFQGLDPEDLREIVGSAVAELISLVDVLGGTVTSVSGAGLAAVFGAPLTHEDDPERAVRAGYRMTTAAGSHALAVRVGIETGLAVVGPITRGPRGDYGAVGGVVGAAAALQSVAKPGSVLVGPSTLAAVQPLFEWGPVDEVAASSVAKPLVGTYLERPKARSSGQASRRRVAGDVPIVGRSRELQTVREALREAAAGQGGVLLLRAEPGLGKSRLVYECRRLFIAWVGAASGRLPLWLEGRATSYASSTPYGLYQQLLSAWVGATPDEGEEVARPALERAMRAVFGDKADNKQVELLANVMGIGADRRSPALVGLNAEELQRATFDAVRALVSRLMAHGPTVLVLEDLHWSDPTSLRLTEQLSSLCKEGPLLLVLTRRLDPDVGASFVEEALSGDAGLTLREIDLSPLPSSDERELARALLVDAASERVVDAVCRGTEGNPLFLEERFSSLLETRSLVKDERGWCLVREAPDGLPEALERLVRSRVDRLKPGPRHAIVAASVLGTEFGIGVLAAVAGLNGGLVPAVEALCSAGLLTELRKVPERTFRFRHALIQESIYGGLVRGQRRNLHARAAYCLEEAASLRADEMAAALGHHYAMAGETGRALYYLGLAGDRAAKAFANEEAITSYRYALRLVGEWWPSPAVPDARRTNDTVDLQAKLGEVLLRTGRCHESRDVLQEAIDLLGTDDAFRAAGLRTLLGHLEVADHNYDAAMAAFEGADALLGDHIDETDQASVDLWLEVQLDGYANVYYWRNEPEKGAEAIARARSVVQARGTPAQRRLFHLSLAIQKMRASRYRVDDEILGNLRAAVVLAQEAGTERDIAWSLCSLGFGLLWRGELAEAEGSLSASLKIVERIGDSVLQARCLCYLTVAALRGHDPGTVRSLSSRAMEAGQDASYPEYVAAAMATQAWLAWREERAEDVVTLAGQALQLWGTTTVSYSWYWICLWPLIAVHLDERRVDQAIDAARQLLPPPQQRLPDELESAVQAAIAAFGSGDRQLAHQTLSHALELAQRLRYC